MSSGLLTPQSDGASISSFPAIDNQSQELPGKVATIRLAEDVPLRSIEGRSTDSSGGVNISRETVHSWTPSLSLTPPPANDSETRDYLRSGGFGGVPASRGATASIDGRLGMSEVEAAIEVVARGSDGPGASLHPEIRADSNSSSHRRVSRKRSSSRTNIAPHDVTHEELPRDRFHEPVFQQAFSDTKRFISDLTDVLSTSSLCNDPGSTMRRLHEEAGNLARFQCPSTRTVGFVGDSGVGEYDQVANTVLS
jgi:hypothetical protein